MTSDLKATITPEIKKQLEQLDQFKENHPFWNNKLFKACDEGTLTKEDWRYIFSQYYLYNKNFTRYLAAIMTNCENDYYRACLSENLWEEGGGAAPEDRHAEMFRKFLTNTLGIDIKNIEYQDFSKRFSEKYLSCCRDNSAMYGSAFLSLGTEGMVARLYSKLIEGMNKAGIPDEELKFFHLHVGCDDEHAETLAEMMAYYADNPHWYSTCEKAADEALSLRAKFFDNLYETLWLKRVSLIADEITEKKSIFKPNNTYVVKANEGEELYSNKGGDVEFKVTRISVDADILDPRINKIAPGKTTETHAHAHETIIYILEGKGEFVIEGNNKHQVSVGDTLLVPRWCTHQTINTGDKELTFLAVTDYKLTTRFVGNSEEYYRQNKAYFDKDENADAAA